MLAACLCFKDSASYLDEWLRFHYVQGFRRFYLYDNGSTDDWRKVVRPWIDMGVICACEYPGLGMQREIYDHCLTRARGEVTWLAFIDDDEFLFSTETTPLSVVLADYKDHAGVAVSWLLYGSSGQQHRTDGWVIERFKNRYPHFDRHVKCVVRPERVVSTRVIGHAVNAVSPFQIVDENHRPLSEPLNPLASAKRLRINHYLVKSWDEWKFRRLRPQANTGLLTPHSEAEWKAWDQEWSLYHDPSACKFLKRMGAINLPPSRVHRVSDLDLVIREGR